MKGSIRVEGFNVQATLHQVLDGAQDSAFVGA